MLWNDGRDDTSECDWCFLNHLIERLLSGFAVCCVQTVDEVVGEFVA
jgi:hypothetical protein